MAMTLQTDYSAAPVAGYSGLLVGATENHDIIAAKNAEASASIAFGRAVVWKLSSPATDLDVLLPAVETDTVAGIVIHLQQYSRAFTTTDNAGASVTVGELDGTGLRPGTMMAILRRGTILVTVEDAVAVGDRLWVRAVAGGDPEFLGGLVNADDSTDTIDCTKQGQFLTSAAAGGLAQLYVDFNNKP
jgi:hypothetical protein